MSPFSSFSWWGPSTLDRRLRRRPLPPQAEGELRRVAEWFSPSKGEAEWFSPSKGEAEWISPSKGEAEWREYP